MSDWMVTFKDLQKENPLFILIKSMGIQKIKKQINKQTENPKYTIVKDYPLLTHSILNICTFQI